MFGSLLSKAALPGFRLSGTPSAHTCASRQASARAHLCGTFRNSPSAMNALSASTFAGVRVAQRSAVRKARFSR